MKPAVKIVVLITLILAILAGIYFLVAYAKPRPAGIYIETTPQATVYVNGEILGKTPFSGTRKPGEIIVRLIPDAPGLSSFETKVSLVSDIQTLVKRNFGESEETTSGEVISFVKTGGKEAEIAAISIPDSALLTIDGQKVGHAPYKNTISVGDHQLIISATGYFDESLTVKTHAGYKLTLVVKLRKRAVENLSEPLLTPIVPQILILETPTGFLRVRSKPGKDGEEVGQVRPGEKYDLLGEDGQNGWFQIEYEKGKTGWISVEFAQKIEASEASPSAIPNSTGKSA